MIIAGMVALTGCSSAAETIPPCQRIRLVITGDLLGAIQSCDCPYGQPGGLDRRKTIFDRIRTETPDAVFIDCGRLWKKQPDSLETALLGDLMDRLQYDFVRHDSAAQGNSSVLNIASIRTMIWNLSDVESDEWDDEQFQSDFFDRLADYDLVIIAGGGMVESRVERRENLTVAYPDTYGSHILVIDMWCQASSSDTTIIDHYEWEAIQTETAAPDSVFKTKIDQFYNQRDNRRER